MDWDKSSINLAIMARSSGRFFRARARARRLLLRASARADVSLRRRAQPPGTRRWRALRAVIAPSWARHRAA
ncbi:hypothetical protein Tbd_2265 [Thiobacillus denitrificans ATCC 25259]|uniref:Uncharacterized protein n=1 Tax=Thiobacillus denitrificans (strain ATCC 25259 / T1) TaxID=292415 RepID=Q3SGM9_THIDA|nr:hypothetical protein Tbd_2265 [Thiobacillus denitrificans ATCC 25259]